MKTLYRYIASCLVLDKIFIFIPPIATATVMQKHINALKFSSMLVSFGANCCIPPSDDAIAFANNANSIANTMLIPQMM